MILTHPCGKIVGTKSVGGKIGNVPPLGITEGSALQCVTFSEGILTDFNYRRRDSNTLKSSTAIESIFPNDSNTFGNASLCDCLARIEGATGNGGGRPDG